MTSDPPPDITSLPLPFLSAEASDGMAGEAHVMIARSPAEFLRCLEQPSPALQWIQIEGMLDRGDLWAAAARGRSGVPLDVVMADPATEFPLLYRLVDVRNTRDVRVTIPLRNGFPKALRLAASLQLPVRLLPGQPDRQALAGLRDAVGFYLHDPMVEAPVEFFHSTLAWCRQASRADLWVTLEQDPAVFPHLDQSGAPVLPADRPGGTAAGFVDEHLRRLEQERAECARCRWRDFCRGYFKLPDPDYSCAGIVALLDLLEEAARQMDADLAPFERQAKAQSDPGS